MQLEQHHHHSQAPADSNQLVAALLQQMLVETLKGRPSMPMAALCKRLGVRMSTLQRQLTALADYELVESQCDAGGRWTTNLTEQGRELAHELLPQHSAQAA